MRRAAEAAFVVNALVEHAKERGFPLILEWGSILQGWAMAHNGEVHEGIELICKGLAITRRTGARFPEPFVLGLLAEAYDLVDEPAHGLIVLSEALTIARVTGQIGWNAELNRLRADLLRHLPRPDLTEVEGQLRTALSVARDQGTRGYELRAAVSLCRLFADQGRLEEARQLLTPVYGWFTEGFDMPDLQEAKALLDEVS